MTQQLLEKQQESAQGLLIFSNLAIEVLL